MTLKHDRTVLQAQISIAEWGEFGWAPTTNERATASDRSTWKFSQRNAQRQRDALLFDVHRALYPRDTP